MRESRLNKEGASTTGLSAYIQKITLMNQKELQQEIKRVEAMLQIVLKESRKRVYDEKLVYPLVRSGQKANVGSTEVRSSPPY